MFTSCALSISLSPPLHFNCGAIGCACNVHGIPMIGLQAYCSFFRANIEPDENVLQQAGAYLAFKQLKYVNNMLISITTSY